MLPITFITRADDMPADIFDALILICAILLRAAIAADMRYALLLSRYAAMLRCRCHAPMLLIIMLIDAAFAMPRSADYARYADMLI